jgi:hypothetical protein
VLLLAALVGSVVLAVKGKQEEEDKGQKQIGDSTAAGKKKKTK